MEILLKNLDDTKKVAKVFADTFRENGGLITLKGAIGAGKTTFTKQMLKEYGVEQNVTSPTFVILNEYYGEHLPVYHFDLYRLENEGLKTIMGEILEYIKPKTLTLIEWADFGEGEIPKCGINLEIKFADIKYGENSRIMNITSNDTKDETVVKKLYEDIMKGIEHADTCI